MKFYSLEDLRYQGNLWNKRYNNLHKLVLGFKTPNEGELEKLNELFNATGVIRCQNVSHHLKVNRLVIQTVKFKLKFNNLFIKIF